jgi:hypothetical protein
MGGDCFEDGDRKTLIERLKSRLLIHPSNLFDGAHLLTSTSNHFTHDHTRFNHIKRVEEDLGDEGSSTTSNGEETDIG